MIKKLIALCHMSVKEFIVELLHEKTFRDLGSGFFVTDQGHVNT